MKNQKHNICVSNWKKSFLFYVDSNLEPSLFAYETCAVLTKANQRGHFISSIELEILNMGFKTKPCAKGICHVYFPRTTNPPLPQVKDLSF